MNKLLHADLGVLQGPSSSGLGLHPMCTILELSLFYQGPAKQCFPGQLAGSSGCEKAGIIL